MDSIGRDMNLLELNLEIPIPGSVLESETVSNVTVRCLLPDTGTSGIWEFSFPLSHFLDPTYFAWPKVYLVKALYFP